LIDPGALPRFFPSRTSATCLAGLFIVPSGTSMADVVTVLTQFFDRFFFGCLRVAGM
jgi:hypothetical protein